MTVKDIRPALVAFLNADAGIAAAIETSVTRQNGGSRCFPGKLPQGTVKPSYVYTLISDPGDYHNDGPSTLAHPRYQLDAWAQTLDAATSLANLIKDRIDGYRGEMGSGATLVNVRGVFRDASGREEFDETARLWRNGRDYLIWFDERV
jgi:hypothetical protein